MADDELLKRVMPNDIKAEQSVLGAMFIDNEVIGPVVELSIISRTELFLMPSQRCFGKTGLWIR